MIHINPDPNGRLPRRDSRQKKQLSKLTCLGDLHLGKNVFTPRLFWFGSMSYYAMCHRTDSSHGQTTSAFYKMASKNPSKVCWASSSWGSIDCGLYCHIAGIRTFCLPWVHMDMGLFCHRERSLILLEEVCVTQCGKHLRWDRAVLYNPSSGPTGEVSWESLTRWFQDVRISRHLVGFRYNVFQKTN